MVEFREDVGLIIELVDGLDIFADIFTKCWLVDDEEIDCVGLFGLD